MTADQVLDVLDRLAESGIEAWVDGGWGVDALVGTKSRDHSDVDLVVSIEDVSAARALFEGDGYPLIRDWLPAAIAFEHDDGRSVDLHAIERTADGGGDQVQLDGVTRWHYTPPVTGRISDREVVCVSLESQLAAHVGYEPDEDDVRDMRLLQDHFGCELPGPYSEIRAPDT